MIVKKIPAHHWIPLHDLF
jgi:hypothetical protein